MVARVPASSVVVGFVSTVVVASFCCCTSIFLCCISFFSDVAFLLLIWI